MPENPLIKRWIDQVAKQVKPHDSYDQRLGREVKRGAGSWLNIQTKRGQGYYGQKHQFGIPHQGVENCCQNRQGRQEVTAISYQVGIQAQVNE